MTATDFYFFFLIKVLPAVFKFSSDLVDIMVAEYSIKQCVEVIQKINHFNGITERGDGGETHNVAEVDCHLIEVLWLHCGASLESLSNRTGRRTQRQLKENYKLKYYICQLINSRWKHLRKQLFCSLLFHLQLFCSLSDQIFQVRAVLLQHPQHGVYDIGLLALVYDLELVGI